MKIRVITGQDLQASRKIKEIVGLYNKSSGLNESFSNDYPDKARIAYMKGGKGGVIAESLFKGGFIVYYAALEEELCGKGNVDRLIDAIEGGNGTVYGVQVNPFDNFDVWIRKGFEYTVILNGVVTLIKVPPDRFQLLLKSRPNNENF